MQLQLTRKRIFNTLLISTLAIGIGSFNSQPAAAQLNRGNFREVAEELNLSRSQMREVGGIMRDLNSDVEDILTPEQFQLLQSTREQKQPQDPQELQNTLNLTDTQSTQLATVREETVVELQSVLTPDQIEKMMEMTALNQL